MAAAKSIARAFSIVTHALYFQQFSIVSHAKLDTLRIQQIAIQYAGTDLSLLNNSVMMAIYWGMTDVQ